MVVAVSLAFFLTAIPYVRTPLPKLQSFIPMYEVALIVTDTITSILLFGQFSRTRSWAMLVLASGYLYCAFITIPHLLTFPGAFTETGLLGAGSQSTAWLYTFWHAVFPMFVIAYALLRNRSYEEIPQSRVAIAILLAVGTVASMAVVFAALATAGMDFLPIVMEKDNYSKQVTSGVSPATWALSALALIALWRLRRVSTLDLWLMVVMCVWIFDVGLSGVFGSARYDLGWYAGRSYGLLAASFILGVLLVETNLMHGRLARTKSLLSEALEKNAARFKEIFDNAPLVVTVKDLQGRYIFVNRGTEQWTEHTNEELIGKTVRDLFGDSDYTRTHEAADREVIETKNSIQREFITPHPLGPQVSLFAKFPLFDGRGEVEGVGSIALDITEQRKADAALKRFFETSVDLILVTDRKGVLQRVSPSVETVLGYKPEEMTGRSAIDFIHIPDLEATREQMRQARVGKYARNFETRYRHRDGRIVLISWTGVWSEDLQQHFFIGRDMTERQKLEQELRQSQKMEAIGQLTGGLAHDYNNLLTVILGNAELLLESLRDRSDLLPLAQATVDAAERSAALTQRLLAFGRRQALEPKTTDLNMLVTGMIDLVRITIGEQYKLDLALEDGPWIVEIDQNQLETALLNLIVNARDAMKGGGTLRIETAKSTFDKEMGSVVPGAREGDFMMVAVHDNGTGMDPETLNRVFEPFFTTKAPGKGTGLGLSMVYGFVKQSGGHITVYSEVGFGTAVKLYFPRSGSAVAERPVLEEENYPRGQETVLLVEDDEPVRINTERQLVSLGYRVVGAPNGKSAIDLLEKGLRPDLLLTDVIMTGGMNGRELADYCGERYPSLRVLFMSGYTSGVLADDSGALPASVHFLGKPFRRGQLAKAVREALDTSKSPVPA